MCWETTVTTEDCWDHLRNHRARGAYRDRSVGARVCLPPPLPPAPEHTLGTKWTNFLRLATVPLHLIRPYDNSDPHLSIGI